MHPLKSIASSLPIADKQSPSILGDDLVRVLDACYEGVALAEANTGCLVYVNPMMAKWLGHDSNEICGLVRLSDVLRIGESGHAVNFDQPLLSSQAMQGSYSANLLAFSQAPIPVEIRIIPLTAASRPLVAVLASQQGQAIAAKTGPSLARRDPLTGLPDRAFALARLAELLRTDRSPIPLFAVLFVDLDNFKTVNDAHGHLMGDRVLQEVAQRLSECVRDQDQVARFGGDEFVVLAEGVAAAPDVAQIISRIHAQLEDPIRLPVGQITLSVSVGVAVASASHRTPEDILAEADRAMYASKRAPAGSR